MRRLITLGIAAAALPILVLVSTVKAEDIAELWQTAQNTGDRLARKANVTFKAGKPPSEENLLTIDSKKLYQTMVGFGGAFTDSAAHVFSSLDEDRKQQVLDMYFSEDGLQYSMARLPMGSCDFSYNHYNYDNVSGDKDLKYFSIEHDKAKIIPLIQAAMKTRSAWNSSVIKILASPWSAPGWMKENHNAYCPLGCLGCQLQKGYEQTWANYFVKFIEAYQAAGVPIWGVTVQNEPGACSPVYECMHFTPDTERNFIGEFLGQILSSAFPDVNLLIYDHNKDKVVEWSQAIYNDQTLHKYIWGTAVHWYSGDDFPNLSQAHELFPTKPILATEATVKRESDPRKPLWAHGEKYAHDMIGDFNNWVVGFIDWNLMLDMYGGPNHAGPDECEGIIKCGSDAMLLINTTSQAIYPQIFYYYMGHFSKFIQPGSSRLSIENSSTMVEAATFLTPDKQTVVVVALNQQDTPVHYTVYDKSSESYISLDLPEHGIQTILYKAT